MVKKGRRQDEEKDKTTKEPEERMVALEIPNGRKRSLKVERDRRK